MCCQYLSCILHPPCPRNHLLPVPLSLHSAIPPPEWIGINITHCYKKKHQKLTLVEPHTSGHKNVDVGQIDFISSRDRVKFQTGISLSKVRRTFPRIPLIGLVHWNCRSLFTAGCKEHCSTVSYVASLVKSHVIVGLSETHSTLEACMDIAGCLPRTHAYFVTHCNRHKGGLMLCIETDFLDSCSSWGISSWKTVESCIFGRIL